MKTKFLNEYSLIFQKRLGDSDYQALKLPLTKKYLKNHERYLIVITLSAQEARKVYPVG